MKRALAAWLALWLALAGFSCAAGEESPAELRAEQADGSVLVFAVKDGACILKGYERTPADLVIPDRVDGLEVREIEAGCFRDCRTLRSVALPAGLKWISSETFEDCAALETVVFPAGLQEIGERAFEGTALRELEFPEKVYRIGDSAFSRCGRLVSVTMPARSGTLRIEDFAFSFCPRLSRIILPEGIQKINGDDYTGGSDNLLYVYYPASLESGLSDMNVRPGVTVFTPAGSAAEAWARENGLRTAACGDPEEMPQVLFAEVENCAYRIVDGEAQLQHYTSTGEPEAVIPAEVYDYPVTAVLSGAFDETSAPVRKIVLPATVTLLKEYAVEFQGMLSGDIRGELYIPNPDAELEMYSVILSVPKETSVTLFAPAGSSAQRYAEEKAQRDPGTTGTFRFSEWNGMREEEEENGAV